MSGQLTRGRKAGGVISLLAPVIIGGILIPLGFLAYEASSARAQFNQLQAATDAAALGAATFISNSANLNLDETTKNIGLHYFQKNKILLSSLSIATLTADAFQDNPAAGDSTFSLIINKADKTVTAKSAFGLQPSFMKFLGVFPLHAISVAGPGKSDLGDVVIVVDLSLSMLAGTQTTKTVQYERHYITPKKTTTTTTTTTTTEHDKSNAVTGNSTSSSVSTSKPVNAGEDERSTPPTDSTAVPPDVTHPDGTWTHTSVVTTTQTDVKPGYLYYTHPAGGQRPILAKFIQPLPTYMGPKQKTIPKPNQVAYPAPPAGAREDSAPIEAIDDLPLLKTPNMLAAMRACDAVQTLPINPVTKAPFTKDQFVIAIKEALLAEGKSGNLESQAAFTNPTYHANKSALQFINFTPAPGFQLEYQKIALTVVEPVHDEVQALHQFIDYVDSTGEDVHWSLIGYGKNVGHPANTPSIGPLPLGKDNHFVIPPSSINPNDLSTIDQYAYPLVPLNSQKKNSQEVKDAIDIATLSYGTVTGHALQEARAQLRYQHRPGKPKTIILLTDGLPLDNPYDLDNQGKESYRQAKLAGSDGIRLITVGFFECDVACVYGPNFVKILPIKAGNGAVSRSFGDCRPDPIPDWKLKKLREEIFGWLKDVSTGSGTISLR